LPIPPTGIGDDGHKGFALWVAIYGNGLDLRLDGNVADLANFDS
jgi:hypothetical protein